jgi:hypothetical protein
MKCVDKCPIDPDFFAYNHSMIGPICVLYCPTTFYKHIVTRQCVNICPTLYYKDLTTMQCVLSCPDHYFAEIISQTCVASCNGNNKYGFENICYAICPNNTNADPTTFLCVEKCPFGYYSENKICVTNCVIGFADDISKVCETVCSIDRYAKLPNHQCVLSC